MLVLACEDGVLVIARLCALMVVVGLKVRDCCEMVVGVDVVTTCGVEAAGVETGPAPPVELRSMSIVKGVGAQATAVMPGMSTSRPYPQYGDAVFVLHLR